MSIGFVSSIIRDGVFLVLKICAPILGSALIIGLIIAIFQAVTSIQEQTITFVFKMVVILVVLVFLASWIFTSLCNYTTTLFQMITDIAR